jgi:hypothetical protein
MQILNVALGGTLQQDIPNHRVSNLEDPEKPVHRVAVRTETLLSSIVRSPSIEVNSRHHQAVYLLSPNREPRLASAGPAAGSRRRNCSALGGLSRQRSSPPRSPYLRNPVRAMPLGDNHGYRNHHRPLESVEETLANGNSLLWSKVLPAISCGGAQEGTRTETLDGLGRQ